MEDSHILAATKTLTSHQDPAEAALAGARRALGEAGRNMEDVARFIHGTTLATNALIERRGAKVATVTTEGFRDILEIAYERRYSQYDIALEKPELLVPRERSFTISGRMDARGNELVPLDEDGVAGLAQSLGDVEAVAICLMHSYANADHEQRLRDLLGALRPDLAISLSSDVSPEAREFDRLCTTVANAFVQPLMAQYLGTLEQGFLSAGLRCPILMMTAGGGMTTLDTAARFPIRLVESGPAGGAILAARVARACRLDQVLSFDMGGTTAKLCLIDNSQPRTSRQFEIARAARFVKGSGMPVRIPVVEMIEIGAGGGSIASTDRLGRLTVGPKSAGSEPGPVGFGRGGTDPTVTDADIALGYIPADGFAEGQFSLDIAASKHALETQVGAALQLDAIGAAQGISDVVDESMASAARMHAVESGADLEPRTMIAFGGNGPVHACRVARSAGVRHVLIPKDPGVGSAVGFLHAPVSYEIVRSRYEWLETLDTDAVNTLLDVMIEEATRVVRQGAPYGALQETRSAFMRYHGQGHEIEIALPDRVLEAADLGSLSDVFEAAYSRQFSRPVPGMAIEILNWAVRVTTNPESPVQQATLRGDTQEWSAHPISVWCDVSGAEVEANCIPRASLEPGQHIDGPALITEPQTTTFVASDFEAQVDGAGNLVLSRKPNGE